MNNNLFKSLVEQFNENRQDIYELIEKNKELKRELSSRFKELSGITNELRIPFTSLDLNNIQIKSLLDKKETLKYHLNVLYENHTKVKDILTDKYEDLSDLNEKIEYIKSKLQDCYNDLEDIKEIINDIRESHSHSPNFDSYIYKRDKIKEQISDLKDKRSDLMEKRKDVSCYIRENKQKKESYGNQIERLKSELNDINKDLNDRFKIKNQDKESIGRLKDDEEICKEKINILKNEIESNNLKINELRRDNESLSYQIDKVKKE